MRKWETASPSTLAWEDACLVTEMTPGETLAHIHQLTSTDQVSCALSSMLGLGMRKPSLYPQDFSILLEKQEKHP